MHLSETLRLILDGIGRSEEYEFYLRKFRADRSGQSSYSAILVVDGATLYCNSERQLLLYQLRLLRELGLSPLLLFAGPESKRQLEFICQSEHSHISTLQLERPLLAALADEGASICSRILFVRRRAGLTLRNGEPLQFWSYNRDSIDTLDPPDQAVAALAADLARSNRRLQVSVTSPAELLRELFTVKGAGSYFRPGCQIDYYRGSESLSTSDRARLIALLEDSFSRRLSDRDYLDSIDHFYIESEYRGAILLREMEWGGCYLCKFAVGTEARGEGVAQELWERVVAEHKELFWRSRSRNSVSRWYSRVSDGQQRLGEWSIFWKGVAAAVLPDLIEYARNKKEDFVKPV